MAQSGRITVISDLSPRELLDIAEEIANDTGCELDDLRDKKLKGFHILDAPGDPPLYTPVSLVMMATNTLRVPLDIEVYVDRDKNNDARLTLDWVETGNSLRPRVCETFAESFADELETRVEDEGGEIIASDSD